MRTLGKVTKVTPLGRLIVRSTFKPQLGSPVYDERMKRIGVVYDVMGPVSSPYVSVKTDLEPDKLRCYVGRNLYVPQVRRKRRR